MRTVAAGVSTSDVERAHERPRVAYMTRWSRWSFFIMNLNQLVTNWKSSSAIALVLPTGRTVTHWRFCRSAGFLTPDRAAGRYP